MGFYKWVFFLISCQFCVHGQQQPPGGYYTTRYDHIDIEHILNQKRLVHYYAECLLDRGPCTPQGIEFKRILPEALRTNCLRCTEKQRFVTLKSIKRLKKEYPHVWAELSAIWDPTGEYLVILEDSLNNKPNRSPSVLPAPTSTTPPPPPPIIFNIIPEQLEPKPSQEVPSLIARFGDSPSDTVNVPISTEMLPTPRPHIQAVTVNKIANKPLSFSSTTIQPTFTNVFTTKPQFSSTTYREVPSPIPIDNSFRTTTKRIFSTILQEKFATSTHRISYNYDFAVTIKPIHVNPATGINMVIKSVNTIIQPITDIAGKVITAGTDIAGIVLNALGVRKIY